MGVAILPSLLADDDEDLIRLLPPERVISAKLWLVVIGTSAGSRACVPSWTSLPE